MTKHNQIDMAIPEARADAPASFVVYPWPKQKNLVGQIGMFALGFIAGVAAVAITSSIINDHPDESPNFDDTAEMRSSVAGIIDVTDYSTKE